VIRDIDLLNIFEISLVRVNIGEILRIMLGGILVVSASFESGIVSHYFNISIKRLVPLLIIMSCVIDLNW
jgi:hypothetical protein